MGKSISILMPAYNHEHYVLGAVESVLAQTYGDLELIVIDDASRDATWDRLTTIRDKRLRMIRHGTNAGAHATLNEAAGLAKGDFLAILNSDDIYPPARLERMLAESERWNGEPGLAFSDVIFIDAAGADASSHRRAADYRQLCEQCKALPAKFWFLAGNPAIGTSNLFFTRSLAEVTGAFAPLRYTHDWNWILRAARHGRVSWVYEPLLRYRVHEGNTLAEDGRWRHVHENSYVQACALLALSQPGNTDTPLAETELLRALLSNQSLHPLSLLCFLTLALSGNTTDQLLAAAEGSGGDWLLPGLAAVAGLPETVFHDLRHLSKQEEIIDGQAALIDDRWNTIQRMSDEIASRDACIASQAALIDDRWNTIQRMSDEIANRDACIASQASMVDERWRIIQQMNEEIALKDRQLTEMEFLRSELNRINGNVLVRLIRRLRWL